MVSTAPPPDEKSKTTHHMIHMYAETERGEKRLEDIDRILPSRGKECIIPMYEKVHRGVEGEHTLPTKPCSTSMYERFMRREKTGFFRKSLVKEFYLVSLMGCRTPNCDYYYYCNDPT